ncbi:MAG: J domain-containing protein [Alphaproteobacteria bacterium]
MPRIKLKPKSPEFEDINPKIKTTSCEMPGCPENADYKAPKHRGLDDHYNFCFEHVCEYNKAWDFFSGMSDHEVQDHVYKSMYGDRPTWNFADSEAEEALHRAAKEQYFYSENSTSHKENASSNKRTIDTSSPEHEAMAIMGLAPPVTLDEIKTRYKALAKKHHPDLNRDNPKAEELLKQINMAYTVLKLAFQEFENLPNR